MITVLMAIGTIVFWISFFNMILEVLRFFLSINSEDYDRDPKLILYWLITFVISGILTGRWQLMLFMLGIILLTILAIMINEFIRDIRETRRLERLEKRKK